MAASPEHAVRLSLLAARVWRPGNRRSAAGTRAGGVRASGRGLWPKTQVWGRGTAPGLEFRVRGLMLAPACPHSVVPRAPSRGLRRSKAARGPGCASHTWPLADLGRRPPRASKPRWGAGYEQQEKEQSRGGSAELYRVRPRPGSTWVPPAHPWAACLVVETGWQGARSSWSRGPRSARGCVRHAWP